VCGEQRLHTSEGDEHIAGVAPLDLSGDDLSHAVAELVIHDLALGLADALHDHLLGGLRRDASELAGVNLVLFVLDGFGV